MDHAVAQRRGGPWRERPSTSWPTAPPGSPGWRTTPRSSCIRGRRRSRTCTSRRTRSSTSIPASRHDLGRPARPGPLHRTALEHLGVRGYPKTTGQRGLQIWIPIEPGPTFDETREWVEQLSRAVGGVAPDLVSRKWEKRSREGRARLDYTQNAINKTLVAPYSVRAAPGAPVSVPDHLGRARRSRPPHRSLGRPPRTRPRVRDRRSDGADAHRLATSRAAHLT